jgi:hypothetical protein
MFTRCPSQSISDPRLFLARLNCCHGNIADNAVFDQKVSTARKLGGAAGMTFLREARQMPLCVLVGVALAAIPGHDRQSLRETAVGPVVSLEATARLVEPDLRIPVKAVDGTQAHIDGLVVDRAGRIFALDRRAKLVRIFDAMGRSLGTLGSLSGGPTEFTNPVGLAEDIHAQLWVIDAGRRRFVVFDTAGRFVTAYDRSAHGYPTTWLGGFDNRGQVYDVDLLLPPRDGAQLVRCTSVASGCTELPLPYAIQPTFYLERGKMVISADVPFRGTLLWRLDHADGLWFGSSDSYRLVHRSFSGRTLAVLSHRSERIAVTDADKAKAVTALQWFTHQGGVVDTAQFGRYKPVIEGFSLDQDGHVWVQTATPSDSDHSIFDLFRSNGTFVRRITIDGRLQSSPAPYITRRALYAVMNRDGEVSIVRYRIAALHR